MCEDEKKHQFEHVIRNVMKFNDYLSLFIWLRECVYALHYPISVVL